MNQEKATQLMKKLLSSPVGRELLGKQLNVEFQTEKEAAIAAEMPTVAVLIPCYDHPEPQMADALAMMYKASQGVAHCFTAPVVRDSSVVSWTRNFLLAELIKTQKPWTHVLFLDDDIIPPPDAITKLLAHKKDIVAAVCTVRKDPPLPNIRRWIDEVKGFKNILDWKEGELLEVGGVGTGMMLISRHALEEVADAYFECRYEKEIFGLTDETIARIKTNRLAHFEDSGNAFWFRFLPSLNGAYEYGEDISFCIMAWRHCGIKVYADTSIQPGHIGRYAFSVRDYLPYKEAVMAEAAEREEYAAHAADPVSELKVSILLPTRGREKNVARLVKSLQATSRVMPEIVLYVDEDDPTTFDHEALKIIRGPRRILSECWNECAKVASGDLLMVAGDDIVFRTYGWDQMVCREFDKSEDKVLMVHGNDGHWGEKFGTHFILHRRWIEALGYITPPYFSADYCDTWVNEVANVIKRRVYLPFSTEHMHPLFGKADIDQTHRERFARAKKDNVEKLYRELASKRAEDVRKLSAIINPLREGPALLAASAHVHEPMEQLVG